MVAPAAAPSAPPPTPADNDENDNNDEKADAPPAASAAVSTRSIIDLIGHNGSPNDDGTKPQRAVALAVPPGAALFDAPSYTRSKAENMAPVKTEPSPNEPPNAIRNNNRASGEAGQPSPAAA